MSIQVCERRLLNFIKRWDSPHYSMPCQAFLRTTHSFIHRSAKKKGTGWIFWTSGIKVACPHLFCKNEVISSYSLSLASKARDGFLPSARVVLWLQCAISLHSRGGAMAESPKLCRYCFQEINPLATVCHHCSKLQTGFFKFLNYITVAEVLSFLISLGLLWFL